MRKILLLILFTFGLNANVYKEVCISCHQSIPAKLDKMFLRYLKENSVELGFKISLKEFLKNPTEEKSLVGNSFIENFSVKDPTELNETQLDEAIGIYWDLYNPKDNLK